MAFHPLLFVSLQMDVPEREVWALGLVAGGASQHTKSGSPAALSKALARTSQNSSKLFTVIQRGSIYHNYHQERIGKNTRGKITRLHFPAQNQGCSLLRLWSSLTMPTNLLPPWRRREGLAPLGCHRCLPGWCFRVTGGGDEPEQGHGAGMCSLAATGDGGRAGRTEHVPSEHPSLSKCEHLKLVPT